MTNKKLATLSEVNLLEEKIEHWKYWKSNNIILLNFLREKKTEHKRKFSGLSSPKLSYSIYVNVKTKSLECIHIDLVRMLLVYWLSQTFAF